MRIKSEDWPGAAVGIVCVICLTFLWVVTCDDVDVWRGQSGDVPQLTAES